MRPSTGQVSQLAGALRNRLAPDARQDFPWGILLMLIPSWATFLLLPERDVFDTENPLYFHPPNLTREPVRVVLQLPYVPLVNTELDQILLVTGLLLGFGVVAELRLGTWAVLGVFWLASTVAAILGGALLHVVYPLFPDVHVFAEGGWYRVFHGGSAGGWALMAAFAATTQRPWPWIGGFVVWESTWWLFLTGDYTPVFHATAVVTGLVAGRWLRSRQDRGTRTASG
jgi:hypothetical protein